MAPGLTETLFALGVGDRVVGVTRYCVFPPEARTRVNVGGYLDPGYETIVALEPDLVVLAESHGEVEQRLADLGISVLRVDQHDVAGILESVALISATCGVAESGGELRSSLERRLGAIRDRASGRRRPRVLVVVGREAGAGSVVSVWAAGPATIYGDIIDLAGGVNVVTAITAAYPELSLEGLLHLDPDVILDLVTDLEKRGLDRDSARADWDRLRQLRAVRDGRVHVLEHDFMVVPGPRIVVAVEEVARLLGEAGV